MNDEYIKRKDVLSYQKPFPNTPGSIALCQSYFISPYDVASIPAADVQPVVHGQWIENKKHLWKRNKYGEIDLFMWENEFHNGPVCDKCGRAPCINCDPDYDDEECYEPHYVCSVCGRVEIKKEPFCNCGADMRGDETAIP